MTSCKDITAVIFDNQVDVDTPRVGNKGSHLRPQATQLQLPNSKQQGKGWSANPIVASNSSSFHFVTS
jgi:hypothetical protein